MSSSPEDVTVVLFSDQVLGETERITHRLLRTVKAKKPIIGYVSSAPDPERRFYRSIGHYYRQVGAVLADYTDLEDAYDDVMMERTLACDAVHLTGGNTFRFLSWIKKRGLSERLIEYGRGGR